MATWPGTLPKPLADGYGLQPVDPTIRTDMDVGAPRVRRRTRARNDRIQLTWMLTSEQADIFRDWYDSDAGAAGGAAWFSVDLDIAQGGIQTVEGRFADMWQGQYVAGGLWRVSATVEVR
jgi:hypothetical protein